MESTFVSSETPAAAAPSVAETKIEFMFDPHNKNEGIMERKKKERLVGPLDSLSEADREAHLKQLYEQVRQKWPVKLQQHLQSYRHLVFADKYYQTALFAVQGRPSLVVFAESAAPTDERILGLKIKPDYSYPDYVDHGHLNLVHCLSYGDGFLLDVKSNDSNTSLYRLNRGTPIFWDLLSCLAGEQDDVKANEMNFEHLKLRGGLSKAKRVENKKRIFDKLKEQGIVLLDISAIPIYLSGKRVIRTNKTKGNTYSTPSHKLEKKDKDVILRMMWEKYSRPLLSGNPPYAFVVIGKSLEDAVSRKAFQDFANEHDSCQYVGCKVHPSLRRLSTDDRRKLLHELGQLAKAAVEGDRHRSSLRSSFKLGHTDKTKLSNKQQEQALCCKRKSTDQPDHYRDHTQAAVP